MADKKQVELLKAGVDVWNQWRAENKRVCINLCAADLRGINLRECDLHEADMRGADLREVKLFEAELFGVNLRAADLRGADLRGVNLRYISLNSKTKLDAKWSLVYDLVNDITGNVSSGDNLVGSDLSGANLLEASLAGTDLTGADLSGANLRGCSLRSVVMRSANLTGAYLNDANLIQADLSYANFNQASLVGANLTHAKVLGTNFSKALLTGTCLKNWHTNRETNLDATQADYVYLDLEDDRLLERRPHFGNFKPGEFSAIFQQAINTLDLAFIDGIDWQAFFSSFQMLRQRYDDAELTIQAIEQKSGGSFVVRLEVSQEADKTAIEKSVKDFYEQQLQLIEANYQAQLQAKDAEIESHRRESANMLEITKLLASKPITIEATAVADNKSSNQNNYGGTNFQNDISGGEVNQAETINVDRTNITTNAQGATIGNFANQMSGNASQTYNAAPDKSLAEAAQEIQTLLDQLSQTYPSETMLQKAQFADAAATQAKANSTLRQRLLSAVDAGTIGAVSELLSHPVATFFIDAVKDWEETKPQA